MHFLESTGGSHGSFPYHVPYKKAEKTETNEKSHLRDEHKWQSKKCCYEIILSHHCGESVG